MGAPVVVQGTAVTASPYDHSTQPTAQPTTAAPRDPETTGEKQVCLIVLVFRIIDIMYDLTKYLIHQSMY